MVFVHNLEFLCVPVDRAHVLKGVNLVWNLNFYQLWDDRHYLMNLVKCPACVFEYVIFANEIQILGDFLCFPTPILPSNLQYPCWSDFV